MVEVAAAADEDIDEDEVDYDDEDDDDNVDEIRQAGRVGGHATRWKAASFVEQGVSWAG